MGTAAWTNWRAFEAGEIERENADDELHSDKEFIGKAGTFGPYTLTPVARGDLGSELFPALILHLGLHTSLMPEIIVDGKLAPTRTDAYHGGILSDEIAALVSLELGTRLRFAGTRSLSGIHRGDDPSQGPYLLDVPRTARPGSAGREILPRCLSRSADLNDLDLTIKFSSIDEKHQVPLVRAARSYADAIWWANQDPNQAWLQLVTALEIAAKTEQSTVLSPEDAIAELDPDLWMLLKDLDDAVRASIAKRLAPQHRITRTFLDFVVAFAPGPPAVRNTWNELDWSAMREHARIIYRHRSKALHEGTPFPLPMLAQEPSQDPHGTPAEVPDGLNSGGAGAVWMADQYPMTLSMFEYIVRGVLLNWWRKLMP